MFGRLKVLPQLLKTGRLAWRLFRDPRVPVAAKLILGATAVYLAAPIDLLPDLVPGLGQADDLLALIAGLNLFIKACPRWLVDEHEGKLGRGRGDRDWSADEPRPPADRPIIDADYREVR